MLAVACRMDLDTRKLVSEKVTQYSPGLIRRADLMFLAFCTTPLALTVAAACVCGALTLSTTA
ncbi:hypothetical protein B1H18_11310 [Streptomyces tsukubensis]|uniref:Uncharacterized protein n=1 Tax=Streptomyces tsukubensis TaxID=83656 RepID=A0A1V4AC41_9ACTN|nr:hypothetical protein B1H18_11310 [Streptomyces tsukubensis]